MKQSEKIAEILAEYQIKFRPEVLDAIPVSEQKNAILRSFRLVNFFDLVIILFSIGIIIDSNGTLDFFAILAGGLIGFSSWRIYAYRSASSKIRKLI